MGSDAVSGGEEFPTVEGFEILEELGGGGMGTVYRATQLEFDRHIALKLINRSLARDPEFRRRFEDEMRVAATLQHPNIVPVYAAGGSGRDLYMAMMLVPGEDLATVVNRDGPMRPAVAVSVVEQIASALDEAHQHRLVHRDVKPQNVIIDARNSHAYLTDFGLARSLDATTGITATGHQMGTLDYMAPEQLSGGVVDHRTDIYALGCLLYAIVSGERPFTGDSLGAVVHQKLDGPSQPTLADRGFDPGLSQVVQRAQADDSASRYDTAGEMARAALSSLGGSATAQAGTVFSPVRTQPMHRGASDPRQRPTAKVPEPPERPRIWRQVALGALAALIVAGIGAAAILASTSGSGGGNESVNAADSPTTTSETTTTVTDTTSVRTRRTKKPSTSFESFSGNLYFAEVPKGWIPESNEEKNSGRYTSQWRDPSDSNTSVLIDSQSGVGNLDALEAADSVRQQTSQTPGYKEISFGPTSLGGAEAAEWIFQLPEDQRVDYFKVGCGSGFAILGSTSPGRFDEMEPTFRHVAESVTPYCE